MSALTKEQLKAEKMCVDTLKGLSVAQRSNIIAHLINLRVIEIERLLEHSDPVKLHRSQGASRALTSLIELING